MMKRFRFSVFGLLLLVGQYGNAATPTLTQWGVTALSAYGDCFTPGSCNLGTFWGGEWTPMVSPSAPQEGGLNKTFASQTGANGGGVAQIHDVFDLYSSSTDPAYENVNMGTTWAEAELDNSQLSVPVLKAKAESYSEYGWVSAFAFGIQGYEYQGGGDLTITLTATLRGNIVNPDPILNYTVTGFSVGIWLLSPDPVMFPDPQPPATPPATLGELVALVLGSTMPAASWEPPDVIKGDDSGNVYLNSTPISITLDSSNKEFYLMAGLVASATGPDRSADAFGTLTMTFQDASSLKLVPASPVPEPESWAMMGIGVIVLGWVARRRRFG